MSTILVMNFTGFLCFYQASVPHSGGGGLFNDQRDTIQKILKIPFPFRLKKWLSRTQSGLNVQTYFEIICLSTQNQIHIGSKQLRTLVVFDTFSGCPNLYKTLIRLKVNLLIPHISLLKSVLDS